MERIFTDVPDSDVGQLEQDCKSAGATEVKKERQPNGLWKVTCIYPEKPATSGN